MIGILIILLSTTIASTLKPVSEENSEEEIKKIVAKYVNKIPDLPPKYVINEGISNLISKYYNKTINTFPLYKISLKIDRKPVKIPWTLGVPENINETKSGKKYTYVRVNKTAEKRNTQPDKINNVNNDLDN